MESLYNKEYRLYMEYALQRYLMEKHGISEEEAQERVSENYEEIEQQAKADKYI